MAGRFLILTLSLALYACNSGVSANTANDYLNQQMACVDAGGTRAQIDECRAAVRAKFGTDGGTL